MAAAKKPRAKTTTCVVLNSAEKALIRAAKKVAQQAELAKLFVSGVKKRKTKTTAKKTTVRRKRAY
jgi:hypothetical protein